jgi:hypothetical protein
MIFLKLVVITVICSMALKIILSEGMMLEKLGKWFEYKANGIYQEGVLIQKGNKLYELFICPWCCVTLQSFTAHIFGIGLGIVPLEFNVHFFLRWALVIMASSFISGNLWNLYEISNVIKEKNEIEKDTLINIGTVADIFIENAYNADNDEEIVNDQMFYKSQHN